MLRYSKYQFRFYCTLLSVLILTGCHRRAGKVLLPQPSSVFSTYYSNSGGLFNIGYADGTLKLYDRNQTLPIAVFHDTKTIITTSLFNSADSLMLVSSMDSSVCIYNVAEKRLVKKQKFPRQVFTALFLNNSNNYATCGPDGVIHYVDVNNGNTIFELEHPQAVNFFWFTQNDSTLVCSCEDGLIYVWDFFSKSLTKTLAGHQAAVKCVYISTDDKYLISASSDSSVCIWDMKDGRMIKSLRGHNAGVQVAMFNSNASQAASCDEKGEVIIWSVPDGGIIKRIVAHNGRMCALHYNSTGAELITGSADGSVKIWDTKNWQVKKQL